MFICSISKTSIYARYHWISTDTTTIMARRWIAITTMIRGYLLCIVAFMRDCMTVSFMLLLFSFVTVITAVAYLHGLLMIVWSMYIGTIKCQFFTTVHWVSFLNQCINSMFQRVRLLILELPAQESISICLII